MNVVGKQSSVDQLWFKLYPSPISHVRGMVMAIVLLRLASVTVYCVLLCSIVSYFKDVKGKNSKLKSNRQVLPSTE